VFGTDKINLIIQKRTLRISIKIDLQNTKEQERIILKLAKYLNKLKALFYVPRETFRFYLPIKTIKTETSEGDIPLIRDA